MLPTRGSPWYEHLGSLIRSTASMRFSTRLMLLAGAAYLPCEATLAHFMTQPYLLPIPFWMYAYACTATLVVTFAVLGYFSGTNTQAAAVRTWEVPATIPWSAIGRWMLNLLRIGAVGCLLLTVTAGLFGSLLPTENAAIMLFWIVFMLGFTYLTALVGDLYRLINPWRTLLDCAERFGVDFSKVRVA